MAFANQIDPALLQQLLSGQGIQGWGVGYQGANDTNQNESASGPGTKYLYDTGSSQDRYGVYDQNGQFQEDRSKESSSAQLMRFLAGAGAMYGAGSLLNGGLLGMGGQTAAGLGDLGTIDTVVGSNPSAWNGATTVLGDGGVYSPLANGGTFNAAVDSQLANTVPGAGGYSSGAAAAAAATAPSSVNLGTLGGTMSTGSGLLNGLGNLSNLGTIVGALSGAAGSRDQQQTADQKSTTTQKSTSTRDPYAPSKPFIDQQITQGQQLATQYQQQPFSAAQQTGYNNLGGLLNAINGNVGGLLSGMGAASSGANNFDRSNPRKALQGGGINLGGWSPGLLQFFPNGGR